MRRYVSGTTVLLCALLLAAGGAFIVLRPGWESLDTVTKLHRFFETAGVVAALITALSTAGFMVYGRQKDALQARATEEKETQLKNALTQQADAAAAADRRAQAAEDAAAKAQSEAAANAGRRLTDAQRETIRRVLSKYPRGNLGIGASAGDGEAIRFSEDIGDAVRMAGWKVQVGNGLMFGSPPGLVLGVCGPKGTVRMQSERLAELRPKHLVPPSAVALDAALSEAGLRFTSFQIYENTEAQPGTIGLTVGYKPSSLNIPR